MSSDDIALDSGALENFADLLGGDPLGGLSSGGSGGAPEEQGAAPTDRTAEAIDYRAAKYSDRDAVAADSGTDDSALSIAIATGVAITY